MKTFNSIEEIQKYYNKNTNTYDFFEDFELLDVEFNFNLEINANITARNITAWNINARNINAWEINAWDISYYAVCFAYNNIECVSIKGKRVNAKHFVLDGEITIKPKEQPKKSITLELTDEQLEKIKKVLGEMK